MEKVEKMWSQTGKELILYILIYSNRFISTAFDENNEGEMFVKRLLTTAKTQEIVNVNNPDEFSLPPYYDAEIFLK